MNGSTTRPAALVNGEVSSGAPDGPAAGCALRVAALASVGAVLVLAGALVRFGLPFGPADSWRRTSWRPDKVRPTGLIGCWGQGPGFLAGPSDRARGGRRDRRSVAAAVLRQFVSSPEAQTRRHTAGTSLRRRRRSPVRGPGSARWPSDYWQSRREAGDGWAVVTDGLVAGATEAVSSRLCRPRLWPATWGPIRPCPCRGGERVAQSWYRAKAVTAPTLREVGPHPCERRVYGRDVVVTVVARSPEGAQTCPAPTAHAIRGSAGSAGR